MSPKGGFGGSIIKIIISIQGVSGGIVNILGSGSKDELQYKYMPYNMCPIFIEYRDTAVNM